MDDRQIFELWETFKDLLKSTGRPVENLIKWLDSTDFKFAPASTKYHNSFRGGLLKHSLDVYYSMYDYSNYINFYNIPQDTVIITSLLHDICKVNCYQCSTRNTKNEQGEWVQVPFYTFEDKFPIGHGSKSAMLCFMYDLKLTEVEIAMIVNHMGFAEDCNKLQVTALYSKYPQALILHWADEASTYITESKDLPQQFRQRLYGRNIGESLQIEKQVQSQDTITINGTQYKLAPPDAEVDEEEIIELNFGDKVVKVYAPHGDGLPF